MHLKHLLVRSWAAFLSGQGTTGLGFVSPFAVGILSAAIIFLIIFFSSSDPTGRWHAVKGHWKKNVVFVFSAAILGNLLWYGTVFASKVIQVVYDDHMYLATEDKTLALQIRAVTTQRDDFKAKLDQDEQIVRHLGITHTSENSAPAAMRVQSQSSALLNPTSSAPAHNSDQSLALPADAILPPGVAAQDRFKSAYREFGKALGEPTGEGSAVIGIYTVYEHASEIWIENNRTHYFIYNDSRWEPQEEKEDVTSDWLNVPSLQENFPSMAHGTYPFGATALWWSHDRQTWRKKLGLRQWHCEFTSMFRYLVFKDGVMIGMMPETKGKTQPGLLFILMNKYGWRSELSSIGEAAPACSDAPKINDER